MAWYKGGQLALTLQNAAQPTSYSGLHLLATSYLVYAPVPLTEGATALQVLFLLEHSVRKAPAQEQTLWRPCRRTAVDRHIFEGAVVAVAKVT